MHLDKTKSAGWLALIDDAKKYFSSYHDACNNIDKKYANLNALRDSGNTIADSDFTLFWSNIQVMGPSIYARAPQPAITPRFKDRRPLYRASSEMLERVVETTFDVADINQTMLALRDDLTIIGRGVAWVRFEEDESKICVEHLHRDDFLCDPARDWACVEWTARRGWLTKEEMAERFSEEISDSVDYVIRNRANTREDQDNQHRCGVWEVWHKGEDCVVWVVDGVEDTLDHGEPPMKIEGFFPCPRPAFGTLQRGCLIPVPDILQYQSQLDGINELTRRIHSLLNGLQLKGFYTGGGEIGDAIEAAMNANDEGRMMIPVSSLGDFASGGAPVYFLPIDQVAQTLTACVELRRQLIDDVYQIIGLSDIMRGATEASETATAQSIKQQNGSVRVRDKQQELVRIARDICRISAEIISEEYSQKQLLEMSQMEIPSDKDVKAQVKALEDQGKAMAQDMERLRSDPKLQAQIQQNPEAAQQAIDQFQAQMQQLQQQIAQVSDTVTIEQIVSFLRDNRLRPFVLDIETDSTIYPDEMAEKASRAEFLQVFMQAMSGVSQLAVMGPQALALAGGFLKFTLAPYRVGRELDSLIDDFVDAAPQIAEQQQAAQGEGKGEDMAALAEAEMEKAKAQMAKVQADSQLKQAELQQRMTQMQIDTQEKQAKMQMENQKLQLQASKQEQEFAAKMADLDAKQNLMQAQTAKILAEIGLDVRKQDLEEYKAATDAQLRTIEVQLNEAHRAEDVAISERDKAAENQFRERGEARADMGVNKKQP